MNGNSKKIAVVIVCILVVIACVFGSKALKGSKTETKVETTTTETKTEKETTEEGKEIDTEFSTEGDQEAEITYDKKTTTEDTKGDPSVKRDTKAEDELFRIARLYVEDNDLDFDDFTIKKAMIVQNQTVDYVYMQSTFSGKTKYLCYTYDGEYFRKEKQSKLEKEYKQALTRCKFNTKKKTEEGIYYSFPEVSVKSVNEMF